MNEHVQGPVASQPDPAQARMKDAGEVAEASTVAMGMSEVSQKADDPNPEPRDPRESEHEANANPPALHRPDQAHLEISRAYVPAIVHDSPPFSRYHALPPQTQQDLEPPANPAAARIQTERVQYPPADPATASTETLPAATAAVLDQFSGKAALGAGKHQPRKSWFCRNWWWFIPLNILFMVGFIYYIKEQDKLLEALKPTRKWLKRNEAWSWTIPTVILVILSFPPLVGHEIVQLVVGLVYELPVAIGIACLGAIVGEWLVFLVFKYTLTDYVGRRCKERISWAAMQRVLQEAGFRGVLMVRYSIVPPHLANPLFATTPGHSIWLYMITVVLSLPKQIIFVVLGDPSYKDNRGATVAKVVAIIVLVLLTIWGSRWVKRRLQVAKRELKAERDESLMKLTQNTVAINNQVL